jgi:RimJ/RimL family protein N-acetyltransferase
LPRYRPEWRESATISLETDRLIIRNFTPDDWLDLQDISIHYGASEYAQYDHQWPTATEEVKGMAEFFASGDRFHAVCIKESGKVIGLISLSRNKEEQGVFGLGYVFHPAYHGQGYGSEGCRAVIDHAFSDLGARQITSNTAEANLPSCAMLKALGFSETGRHTASFRKTAEGEPIEFTALTFSLTK